MYRSLQPHRCKHHRKTAAARDGRHRRLALETLERRQLLAAFTPGNVVVYRIGDGAGVVSGSSQRVFLDEFTPAGTLVQSVAMPVAASGPHHPLTASTATSEGLLTRSADGRFLVVPGYATPPGTTGVAGTSASIVQRTIGIVDAQANIDTTTTLGTATDASGLSGANIRGATSNDGVKIWVTGGNSINYV